MNTDFTFLCIKLDVLKNVRFTVLFKTYGLNNIYIKWKIHLKLFEKNQTWNAICKLNW